MVSSRNIFIGLIVSLILIVSVSGDLSCLTSKTVDVCNSNYNLCTTCKTGTINCVSGVATLTCQQCNNYSFIINGVTYCSSTQGCSSLDQSTGQCKLCNYSYYATYTTLSATALEMACQKAKINLANTISAINALTGYDKNLIFETKLEIIYKYAIQVLGGSQIVEQARSLWFYSKEIEECGGSSKSNSMYESCQCGNIYYGSRCQLLLSNKDTTNSEISQIIIPALKDLQSSFSALTVFKDQYAQEILFILRTIAEVADGFDVATYTLFYNLQNTFISAINGQTASYGYAYWSAKSSLVNSQSPDIKNWSALYSFYSIFADRLAYSTNTSLTTQLNQNPSSLTLPSTIILTPMNSFYQTLTAQGFASDSLQYLKGTKAELYYQVINESSSTLTLASYSSINSSSDFKFMSLSSLAGSSFQCNNIPINYPVFFVSSQAWSQIVQQTQTSNSNQYQMISFINQYSSNIYQYVDGNINSPIVQAQFYYGVIGNKDFKSLKTYEFSFQQEYVAVLIPKFKTQQYLTGVSTSVTCKVLNESTPNQWSSSIDIGVDNSQTIECDTHVICFYDISKNFGKNIKFAFEMTSTTQGPKDEFFVHVNGDWWKTSGFIITFILIGLFILMILVFLFVPALNSMEAPRRKIQIEQELPKHSNRQNVYKDTNVYTDNLDLEQRQIQAERMSNSQQEEQYSNTNIIETTELDANMSLHIYSILHTTERTYKIQKISILIMNWHFIACFLGVMYKKLTWSDSNIVVGIVYTIIASWFANYAWGFIAVKLRRTVEGSPNVSIFYYILYLCLFILLFYIELEATEYYYDYPNKQKWHGVGFLLCLLFDYLLFDTILLFVYQYLSSNQQSFFHSLGSFLRHRGFYQQ